MTFQLQLHTKHFYLKFVFKFLNMSRLVLKKNANKFHSKDFFFLIIIIAIHCLLKKRAIKHVKNGPMKCHKYSTEKILLNLSLYIFKTHARIRFSLNINILYQNSSSTFRDLVICYIS